MSKATEFFEDAAGARTNVVAAVLAPSRAARAGTQAASRAHLG